MTDIILATFNARFAHCAFGLRYLLANLRAMQSRAEILEFEINTSSNDAIEKILARNPKIVGVGVYIWNAVQSLQLVAELKRVRPEIVIIIGGPEVSYEIDQQEICALADFIITGEADLAFAELCEKVLSGKRPLMKVIPARLPEFELKNMPDESGTLRDEFSSIALPYKFYDAKDVAHRVIYVEASRGCPFKCEFCLSSLDVPVRNVPLESLLGAMQSLLDRGVRQFKFVDRTFNLNLKFSQSILQFFLDRMRDDLFLHFEMIPDRLPDALRATIQQFPPAALQFEVGVQTFNEDVSARISRRQNNELVEQNLRWLRDETGVHVHADLIVGLPGEDLQSFARGFDRLVKLRPQEIQVGMLKRLRGTPIIRHDAEWGMVYSPHAPYEILQTSLIDFASLQRIRRFSKFWDTIANSGNFRRTLRMIFGDRSPFETFLELSDRLFEKFGRTHGIALGDLAAAIFEYLVESGIDSQEIADVMWPDLRRGARPEVPAFLRPFVSEPIAVAKPTSEMKSRKLPPRQARHLSALSPLPPGED